MKEIEKLLKEYSDRFIQGFPLMIVNNATIDEVAEMIKKCLKENKPFNNYDKDVVY